jgi:hypothetical protein
MISIQENHTKLLSYNLNKELCFNSTDVPAQDVLIEHEYLQKKIF